MTPQQKLIEYYLYHYHEFNFDSSKQLSNFQKSLFPHKAVMQIDKPWKKSNPDSLTLFMGHVVQKMYNQFSGTKRDLLKYRYFKKIDRQETCTLLCISTRSYHRYLSEMLEFAQNCAEELRLEQLEYERQLKFFASECPKPSQALEFPMSFSQGQL